MIAACIAVSVIVVFLSLVGSAGAARWFRFRFSDTI
jgi:hypothetical protein